MTQFSQFNNAQNPNAFSSGQAAIYNQAQNKAHEVQSNLLTPPRVVADQDKKVVYGADSIHIEFQGRSKPSSANAGQNQFQTPNTGQSQYQSNSNFAYRTLGASNSGPGIQSGPNSGSGIQSGTNQLYQSQIQSSLDVYPTQNANTGQQQSQSGVYQKAKNVQLQSQNTGTPNTAAVNKAFIMKAFLQKLQEKNNANPATGKHIANQPPSYNQLPPTARQTGYQSTSQSVYQSQSNNPQSNAGNNRQSAYQWLSNSQTNQEMSNAGPGGIQNVYQSDTNVPSTSNTKQTFQRNFVNNPVSYNQLKPTAATYRAVTQRQIPVKRTNLGQTRSMNSDFRAALQSKMANQRFIEPKPTKANMINNSQRNIAKKQQTNIQQLPAPANVGSSSQINIANKPQMAYNFQRVEVTTNAGPIAQDYVAENGVPFLQQAKLDYQPGYDPINQNRLLQRNYVNNLQGMRTNGKTSLSQDLRGDALSFQRQLQAAKMNFGAQKESATERTQAFPSQAIAPVPPTVSTQSQSVGQNQQVPNNVKSNLWTVVSSFLKMQSLSDLKALMKSPQLLNSLQGLNGKTSNTMIQPVETKPSAYQPTPQIQLKRQVSVQESKPNLSQSNSQTNAQQLWMDGSETGQVSGNKYKAWSGSMDASQAVANKQQVWTDINGVNEPVQSQTWPGGNKLPQGVAREQQIWADTSGNNQASQIWSGSAISPNLATGSQQQQQQMLSSNFGTNQAVPAPSQAPAQSWSSTSDLLQAVSKGQGWTDSSNVNQGAGPQTQEWGAGSEYNQAVANQPQTNIEQTVSGSSWPSPQRRRPSDIQPTDSTRSISVGPSSMKRAQVNKPYKDPGSVSSGVHFSLVSASSYSDIQQLKPQHKPETKPQNLRSSIGTAQQAMLNSQTNKDKKKTISNQQFFHVGQENVAKEPILNDMRSNRVMDKSASQNRQAITDTTSYRSSVKTAGSLDYIQEYVDLSPIAPKENNNLFPYRNGGTSLYQGNQYQRNKPTTTTSAPWDNIYAPRAPKQSKSKAPATDIQELPPWEVASVKDPLPVPKIPRPPATGSNSSESKRRGNPIRDPLPVGDSPASRGGNMPMPAPYWRTGQVGDTRRGPGPGSERPWGPGQDSGKPVETWSGGDRSNMSGPGIDRPGQPGPPDKPGPKRMWSPDPYFSATTPTLPMPTKPPTNPTTQAMTTPATTTPATTPATTTLTTQPPTSAGLPPPVVAPYVASGETTYGGIPRPKYSVTTKRPKKKYSGPLRIKALKSGDPPNWDAFEIVGKWSILL